MNDLFIFSKYNTKYTLLLFTLIFGPVVMISGIRLDSRLFLMLIISLFGAIYLYKKRSYIVIPYINIQVFFLIVLFFLLVFIAINSVYLEDIYYLNLVLRMVFLSFITILITSFIKDRKKVIDSYFDYIFYITTLNAVIIILMAHIDPLRNFIQSFQYQTALLEVSGNIRMQSINGMEGATLSAIMFFGAISFFYMSKYGLKEKIYFGLIIYSMIYIGRTGLMFMLMFILFISLKHYVKKYKLFLPMILIPVSLITFLFFNLFLNNLHLFPIEYQHTFRFLTSMSTTETGLPYTVDLLLRTAFFLPEYNVQNIFMGTYGISSLAASGYFSDVGYIKMLFTIGYIGLFLYSLVYIVFLYFALKLKKHERSFEYIVFVVLFLFLFHFKANALTMTAIYFLILLSFNVSLLKLRLQKQENSADE